MDGAEPTLDNKEDSVSGTSERASRSTRWTIVDSRWRQNWLQYLINWKGYGPKDISWEDAEAMHIPYLVC